MPWPRNTSFASRSVSVSMSSSTAPFSAQSRAANVVLPVPALPHTMYARCRSPDIDPWNPSEPESTPECLQLVARRAALVFAVEQDLLACEPHVVVRLDQCVAA